MIFADGRPLRIRRGFLAPLSRKGPFWDEASFLEVAGCPPTPISLLRGLLTLVRRD